MSDNIELRPAKVAWHLWVIGGAAILWNGIGALDYLMTEIRNPSYMASFSAEQLAYFDGTPAWATATWALGVWGGVLGSILLLLRKRFAVPVFAVSLVSAALTFFYNYVLSDGLQIMGGAGALLFSGVILVVAGLLLLYSHNMARNATLR